MPYHTRTFKRDDGTMLEVDGILISEGRGLGWYFSEYKAWLLSDANDPAAPFVTLTEAEDVRLNEEVSEEGDQISSDYYNE